MYIRRKRVKIRFLQNQIKFMKKYKKTLLCKHDAGCFHSDRIIDQVLEEGYDMFPEGKYFTLEDRPRTWDLTDIHFRNLFNMVHGSEEDHTCGARPMPDCADQSIGQVECEWCLGNDQGSVDEARRRLSMEKETLRKKM
nr:hypothetical protein BgiMline_015353 [Biomphalaria glabrata]